MKKLTGAIAAWVVMWGLGGIWHMLIMGSFYEGMLTSVAKAQPSMVMVGLGYLIVALVMAHMFPHGYKGTNATGEGARFGAFVGLLWWLPALLVLSGVYNEITTGLVLVDGIYHIVEGAIGGIVVASLHTRGAGSAA